MHAACGSCSCRCCSATAGPGSPQRRFEAARAEVDALLLAEIGGARASAASGRRRALDAARGRGEDGRPTDGELRDHLITLLLARPRDDRDAARRGRSSGSCATRRRWRAPARRRSRRPRVLDAVVQESQRLRPVITYVMRTLQAPMTVGGHEVPAGRDARHLDHAHAPPRGPLPGAARLPARALPRAPSPRPTRGSRSAAACGAASAPRSRASRCARCSSVVLARARAARAPDPRPERATAGAASRSSRGAAARGSSLSRCRARRSGRRTSR